MQSKKQALYLWIVENKKTMDTHPQMYTRFLSTQTGTETKRQTGGRTSLFTAYHKHTTQ